MNKEAKTVVACIKCPRCKDTVFSRTRHDIRDCSCSAVAIDGGREYTKVLFIAEVEPPKTFSLEIEQSEKELYEDWNFQVDKYGLIKEKKE